MKSVRHVRMRNGFDVYTQEDANTHLMGVGVKSGGFADPKDKVGLAHLAEHHVARGAKDTDGIEIERKLREVGCGPGASINIHTTYQHTFYGTDSVLRRKYALELFDIFAAMTTKYQVTKEGMETELSAIKTEYLLNGIDDMQDHIYRMLTQQIFTVNPIRRRLDCEPSHLEKIIPWDVKKFLKTHYVPNNMFAVILGPSHKDSLELAKKHFGDLEQREVPALDYDYSDHYPIIKSTKEASIVAIKQGIHTYHVGIGFPIEPYTPSKWKNGERLEKAIDSVAVEVLVQLLEHRAHQELRETGKSTYHPYVFMERSATAGLLYVWFPTHSEDLAHKGIEMMKKDFERIRAGGITQEEYKLAITNAPKKNGHSLRKVNNLFGVQIPHDVSMDCAYQILKEPRDYLQRDLGMGVKALKTELWESFETTSSRLVSKIIDATCSGDIEAEWVHRRKEMLDRVGIARLVHVANKVLTPEFAVAMIKPAPNTQEMIYTRGFYNPA